MSEIISTTSTDSRGYWSESRAMLIRLAEEQPENPVCTSENFQVIAELVEIEKQTT